MEGIDDAAEAAFPQFGMHVRTIHLLNFRSHAETHVEFTPGVNLIHGSNGAGKTNLIEAVHYACLTKSFITPSDSFALRRGSPLFEVEAAFESDSGRLRRIRLAYQRAEGKRVFVDGAPLDRLSDVVGIAPVVTFSPEDHVLTSGAPEERRRFLNNVMSQERPVFMADLAKYRRSVRQRNELLGRTGRGTLIDSQEPVFLSWTAEYVASAARIAAARHRFVESFRDYLAQAYVLLGEAVERPEITYSTFGDVEGLDEQQAAELLRRRVERDSRRELEAGRTLIGPHRDDLIFRLNDLDVRRYASHGQHRTFGIALKIAQYLYLHDRLRERPILLLDDVFGILDPDRTDIVLRLLLASPLGQSLITATHAEPFSNVPFDCVRHQMIEVKGNCDGSRVTVPCHDPNSAV